MNYSHGISEDTFREQCGTCGKQIELVKNCELFFINFVIKLYNVNPRILEVGLFSCKPH